MKNLNVGGSSSKGMRLVVLGVLLFTLYKVVNFMLPFAISFATNLWKTLLLVAPLIFIGFFIASNPMFLWMWATGISNKIRRFFIKQDPLSFMDAYIDLLYNKMSNLARLIEDLRARRKIGMDKVHELEVKLDQAFKRGKAAKGVNDNEEAGLQGSYVQDYKESIDSLKPGVEKLNYYIGFFDKLHKNWDISTKKLKNKVETKRDEYKTARTLAKASGMAQEFVKGNTKEGRIFQESVDALQEKVAADIAKIEQFEIDAQQIMKEMALDSKVQENTGMELLEKYTNSSDLFLPEYDTIDADFTVVGSVPKKEFSHLLR